MTFGFVGMLFKLLRGEGNMEAAARPTTSPSRSMSPATAARSASQLYPDYKAHAPAAARGPRPAGRALPSDPPARSACPILGAEGFEADDVIATLVERAPRASTPTCASASSPRTRTSSSSSSSGGPAASRCTTSTPTSSSTPSAFKDETGLTPAQVIDMLALMGDTVDNVPGRRGRRPQDRRPAHRRVRHARQPPRRTPTRSRASAARTSGPPRAARRSPRSWSRCGTMCRWSSTWRRRIATDQARRAASRSCKELGFNRYQDEVQAAARRQRPVTRAASGARHAARRRGQRRRPGQGATGRDRCSRRVVRRTRAPIGGRSARPQRRSDARRASGAHDAQANWRCSRRCARPPSASRSTPRRRRSAPTGRRSCGISFSRRRPGRACTSRCARRPRMTHLDEATVLEALRPCSKTREPKCGHNLKYDISLRRSAAAREQAAGVRGGIRPRCTSHRRRHHGRRRT